MTRPVGVRTLTGSPPTITFPLLLAGSVGALLVYSAVVGKNPVDVVKDAIGQQKPAKQPTAYTGAMWGPYNSSGAGLQPNTFPQYGPYGATGLKPGTPPPKR
jgi:hypothetical protein